jgi:aspartate/glutamate racemase
MSNLKKSSIEKAKDYLIIKSKYMLCDSEHSFYGEELNEKQARVIIPSSIYPYYDEVIFDDLDNFIFNEASNSTYNNLINKIKKYFDVQDIKENYQEFLTLIKGKLENLVYRNVLKVTRI